MTDARPVVVVIDDDLSVREAIQGLLETADLQVELFASPQDYMSKTDARTFRAASSWMSDCLDRAASISSASWSERVFTPQLFFSPATRIFR